MNKSAALWLAGGLAAAAIVVGGFVTVYFVFINYAEGELGPPAEAYLAQTQAGNYEAAYEGVHPDWHDFQDFDTFRAFEQTVLEFLGRLRDTTVKAAYFQTGPEGKRGELVYGATFEYTTADIQFTLVQHDGAWLVAGVHYDLSSVDERAFREAMESRRRSAPERSAERAESFRERYDQQRELLARYEIVSRAGHWHRTLYQDYDFEAVERELARRFAAIDDPGGLYDYGTFSDSLMRFANDTDPDTWLAVLEQWTDERPESASAWLILGGFLQNYAWYWRGGGFAHTVTEEGWRKFHALSIRAREALEKAQELNPDDPEPSYRLVQSTRDLSSSRPQMEAYFNRVVYLTPYHYRARMEKLWYLLPKWHGTWQDVDAVVAECAEKEEDYPLLGLVRYSALRQMSYHREGHEHLLDVPAVQEDIIGIHRRIAETWPDHLEFQNDLALVLYKWGDLAEAAELFDQIGDRYHWNSGWKSIMEYNRRRATIYAAYGIDVLPEPKWDYLDRAVELAPHTPFVHWARGTAFLTRDDKAAAEQHFLRALEVDDTYGRAYESLAGVYLMEQRFGEASRLINTAMAKELPVRTRATLARMRRSIEYGRLGKKANPSRGAGPLARQF